MNNGEHFIQHVDMYIEQCYKCHVLFGMTNAHHDRVKTKGESFYCPNGHSQAYIESTEQRLRKLLDNSNEANAILREEVKARTRALSATKGVVTKLRGKIIAGECPVCGQSFKALSKHMEHKHPDWKEEAPND